MLNMIKNMIKERQMITETAELILENDELDDSIILNEEPNIDEEVDSAESASEEDKKDDTEDTSEEEISKPEDTETPVDPLDDEMNGKKDDEKDDDLPEPVGKQTGEPAEIGDDDLLSTEIDLRSNTPMDTLPTPPASAADVVPSEDTDSVQQKIDSGFGEDDSREPETTEETADLLDVDMDEAAEIPDSNSVASKEEKDEEKAREDAIPTEDTHEFKESDDLLDEDMDAESNTAPAEECGDATEECAEKSEEKTKANTSTNGLAKIKFDKDVDIKNMTPEQIKSIMDPGLQKQLESAGILDKFVEAISIGGADDAAAPADDGTGDNIDVSADPTTDAPADAPADTSTEEPAASDNVVTSAVKDKVAEMNASDGEADASASKEALLRKASTLTKGLEDLKNQILNSKKL